MREYRLVREFNFIIDYEVSQSVLRCTRTDTFINKFSNLSALDQFSAQTFLSSCLASAWFTITSKNTMTLLKLLFYQVEELIASVDSSFGLTWFLTNSHKIFARKLISCKEYRPTRSENTSHPSVLVYHERCVRLYVISSPQKSWNLCLFTMTTSVNSMCCTRAQVMHARYRPEGDL